MISIHKTDLRASVENVDVDALIDTINFRVLWNPELRIITIFSFWFLTFRFFFLKFICLCRVFSAVRAGSGRMTTGSIFYAPQIMWQIRWISSRMSPITWRRRIWPFTVIAVGVAIQHSWTSWSVKTRWIAKIRVRLRGWICLRFNLLLWNFSGIYYWIL